MLPGFKKGINANKHLGIEIPTLYWGVLGQAAGRASWACNLNICMWEVCSLYVECSWGLTPLRSDSLLIQNLLKTQKESSSVPRNMNMKEPYNIFS